MKIWFPVEFEMELIDIPRTQLERESLSAIAAAVLATSHALLSIFRL